MIGAALVIGVLWILNIMRADMLPLPRNAPARVWDSAVVKPLPAPESPIPLPRR